jgi:hypothetical protein
MKKIKYILCFILSAWIFSYSYSVFASSSIRLNTDKNQVDIQDIVELRIDIELENQTESVQIEIPGIDDFMVLWQSESQSTTSINWVSSQNFVLVLTLKWRGSWTYELWPIRIWDLESNIQTIEVTWEQVFIWWQIDTGQALTREKVEEKAQDFGQQLADEFDKQLEEERNKKIIDEYSSTEVPNEFRDIKKLTHISPIHIKNTLFFLILLGLWCICYKIYKHFMNWLKEQEMTEVVTEKKEMIQKQTDFQSLLKDIEIHHLDTDKEVFYWKLGSLMREYFDEKIEKWLSSRTFWELRKQIKKYPSLTRVYEKIYFPEYNLEQDTERQRIELINILKDELV